MLYHDQGQLEEGGTEGQSEEENESEGSSCLPLLLHRGRSVILHHQRYLDEGLHIAVKQLMVIHRAWPRLPHFLWFRGKGGGPVK